MLAEELLVFGTAQLRRRLSSLGDGDSSEVELVLGEVADRRRIAPNIYPFLVTEVGIARDEKTDPFIYAFLVIASIQGSRFRESRDFKDVAILFDLVVECALPAVLGPRSEAIRFAWPTTGDRPSLFPEAVRWLADKLDVSPGSVSGPPRKKDGGVDVVCWRRFGDGRLSFPVVLAQCTIRTDFHQKGQDILVDQWRAWLSFSRAPATALAVPFAIPTTASEWDDDLRFVTDLVLDRMRVCELLEDRLDRCADLRAELETWLRVELDALLVA